MRALDWCINWFILTIRGDPYLNKSKKFFHPNMTNYTPIESPHRVDTRCTVFKNVSCDLEWFCDEKQKEYKKDYKRVQFSSTKSTSSTPSTPRKFALGVLFCVLDVCTLLLFFVLEKYSNPAYRTKTLTVFRYFNVKKLNFVEFIRKARTVPLSVFIWKSIQNRYLCCTLRANSII